MKKIILFSIAFLFCSPHLAFSQQTVSLSTFYPAPFGTYDRVRLVPRPLIPGANCRVGTMYTLETDLTLQYCGENPADLGNEENGVWGPAIGVWDRDGADNIFLVGTDDPTTFMVGINDSTPDAILEVSGDGSATDLLNLSSNDGNDGNRMTVTSAGDVGLGTATPVERLDLADSGGAIALYDDTSNSLHTIGSTGGEGILLRADENPAGGQPIFVVESAGASQRLRVEHDGALKTTNFLEVDGTDPSYIAGNLNVGDTAAGTQTLNINGGIWMEDGGAVGGVLQVNCNAGLCYAVYAP